MVPNKSGAAVDAGPIKAPAGSTVAGEIDLYNELIAFAELSLEEQGRLVGHLQKSAEKTAEPPHPELVRTHPPDKPAEAETATAGFVLDTKDSNAHGEEGGVSGEPFGSSPSGPLSGLTLAPDFVYMGALSRGVCLACGAESGADDLFCITCGVFIDEIGSTPSLKATCGECGLGVAVEEIFCPWCGAATAA